MALNLAKITGEILGFDEDFALVKCGKGAIRVELPQYRREGLEVGHFLKAHGNMLAKYVNDNKVFEIQAFKIQSSYLEVPHDMFENTVVLQGNLTKDFEVKSVETSTGSSFRAGVGTLAFNNKDGTTHYFDIKCTGYLADIVKKSTEKGSLITVLGEIVVERYTDKTGKEKSAFSIKFTEIDFVYAKKMMEEKKVKEEVALMKRSSQIENDIPSTNNTMTVGALEKTDTCGMVKDTGAITTSVIVEPTAYSPQNSSTVDFEEKETSHKEQKFTFEPLTDEEIDDLPF